jgi:hypothetical protein
MKTNDSRLSSKSQSIVSLVRLDSHLDANRTGEVACFAIDMPARKKTMNYRWINAGPAQGRQLAAASAHTRGRWPIRPSIPTWKPCAVGSRFSPFPCQPPKRDDKCLFLNHRLDASDAEMTSVIIVLFEMRNRRSEPLARPWHPYETLFPQIQRIHKIPIRAMRRFKFASFWLTVYCES